jgi:hypothetical protein
MKKNSIPMIKDTNAKMNGMKASMLKKTGIMKNVIDTIINTIPTLKSNALLSIKTLFDNARGGYKCFRLKCINFL